MKIFLRVYVEEVQLMRSLLRTESKSTSLATFLFVCIQKKHFYLPFDNIPQLKLSFNWQFQFHYISRP